MNFASRYGGGVLSQIVNFNSPAGKSRTGGIHMFGKICHENLGEEKEKCEKKKKSGKSASLGLKALRLE